MFDKIFKKKNDDTDPKKEFVIVRSFYGAADHIAVNDGSLPLCGYRNGLYTEWTRDKQEILDSVPLQHQGSFYCSHCASLATGLTENEVLAHRKWQ